MTPTLAIYFATMTGNAETLAQRAHERAVQNGWAASLRNLSEVKPADLTANTLALFIVSTWGDGEPPTDAFDFYYDLEKAALALPALRYAVFGLGDKDYADFNAFARTLDERLAVLGAQRLQTRVEADLDFDDMYAAWEQQVFAALAAGLGSTESAA